MTDARLFWSSYFNNFAGSGDDKLNIGIRLACCHNWIQYTGWSNTKWYHAWMRETILKPQHVGTVSTKGKGTKINI